MPPVTIDGTSGITTPMYGGAITANAVTPSVNMKSRIINGAMVIDQRNAGASVNVTGSGQYPVDRFLCAKDTSGATVTAQQSSVVPANFRNSLLWTTSTGSSPAAGDDNILRQFIEGFNFADLGFGTASAQSFTLSFWVRSSVTGTYGVGFANSAANRAYMGTYTINAANTWEQKTVTVVGDTSGTWVTDSGIGLRVLWDMGSGSSRSIAASSAWGSSYGTGLTGGVKLVQTTGATFYITGVQLEVGSTATSFDYRPYTTELQLCQRYYESTADIGTLITAMSSTYRSSCTVFGASNYFGPVVFKVYKRAVPTVTFYFSTSSASLSGYTTSSASTVGADPQNISQYGCNGIIPSITNLSFVQGNWVASAEL